MFMYVPNPLAFRCANHAMPQDTYWPWIITILSGSSDDHHHFKPQLIEVVNVPMYFEDVNAYRSAKQGTVSSLVTISWMYCVCIKM